MRWQHHDAITASDRETLQALYEVGPYVGTAAHALNLHVNTVKYRLGVLRTLYGLPEYSGTYAVLRHALECGDIVPPKDRAADTAA